MYIFYATLTSSGPNPFCSPPSVCCWVARRDRRETNKHLSHVWIVGSSLTSERRSSARVQRLGRYLCPGCLQDVSVAMSQRFEICCGCYDRLLASSWEREPPPSASTGATSARLGVERPFQQRQRGTGEQRGLVLGGQQRAIDLLVQKKKAVRGGRVVKV